MGQKAVDLRAQGFITGAIDMAWASPQNDPQGTKLVDQIAKTLVSEAVFIETLMNSLYQHTQVSVLWDMWQSQLDSISKETPASRREPTK
jgi:hypothetical protein